MEYIILSWVVMTAGVVWALYCNHQTYRQRIDILEALRDQAPGYHLLALQDFEQVGYHEHFWKLLSGGDAMALYSPEIQFLMDEIEKREAINVSHD